MISEQMKRRIKLIILLIFLTGGVYPDSYKYEFSWMRIPVSEFEIENKIIPITKDRANQFSFKTKSLGPLRLMRNYQSEVTITYTNDGWLYNLNGNDRGMPEKKDIQYYYNGIPVIANFIDDNDVSPITPHINYDKDAIDPFTLIIRTIDLLKNNNTCKSMYKVFDGKRRYRVDVDLIMDKISFEKDIHNIFKCRYTILSANHMENAEHLSPKNRWPFNDEGRSMNIWYSRNHNYHPIRFQLNTPIGRIEGRMIN